MLVPSERFSHCHVIPYNWQQWTFLDYFVCWFHCLSTSSRWIIAKLNSLCDILSIFKCSHHPVKRRVEQALYLLSGHTNHHCSIISQCTLCLHKLAWGQSGVCQTASLGWPHYDVVIVGIYCVNDKSRVILVFIPLVQTFKNNWILSWPCSTHRDWSIQNLLRLSWNEVAQHLRLYFQYILLLSLFHVTDNFWAGYPTNSQGMALFCYIVLYFIR